MKEGKWGDKRSTLHYAPLSDVMVSTKSLLVKSGLKTQNRSTGKFWLLNFVGSCEVFFIIFLSFSSTNSVYHFVPFFLNFPLNYTFIYFLFSFFVHLASWSLFWSRILLHPPTLSFTLFLQCLFYSKSLVSVSFFFNSIFLQFKFKFHVLLFYSHP